METPQPLWATWLSVEDENITESMLKRACLLAVTLFSLFISSLLLELMERKGRRRFSRGLFFIAVQNTHDAICLWGSWAGRKQCHYCTRPLVPSVQFKNLIQNRYKETRGNRAFKWELFTRGSLAASHQRHCDFSPACPSHLHPSPVRLFFSACLLIPGLDEESSTPS